jgi:hypothetical protein
MSKARGRNLALEQKWRECISRQAGSGLSIRAFCQQQVLNVYQFHFWKGELRRRDQGKTGQSCPSAASPAFVQLHTLPVTSTQSPIELQLTGDRRLLLRSGCDLQLFSRVLGILEGKPC